MPYLRSAMGGALLAAAITAPAGAETAIFDFYIAGIKAGEARLDLSETKGAYQAKSRIDAAGLVGALVTLSYDGSSSGQLTRDGAPVPSLFQAHSVTPRTDRRTRIEWKDGVPSSVSVEPARKKAPDPAKQGGTLDPIAAAFAVLRDLPRDQLCDKTLMVFDGSRLSRLRLEPARDTGDTFTCDGKYARVEGEAHSLSSQRDFPFQLVYAEQPNGVGRLERIETRTSFGTATLERRS
ncbi:MAG: DUF3108 domain-containing protein [Amaricoccus sp.]|uniref:DUF3108 domain-containing protein n=1 Tax=Amaricoccus sp. TaxID=1872485 RepID=UPI003314B4F8